MRKDGAKKSSKVKLNLDTPRTFFLTARMTITGRVDRIAIRFSEESLNDLKALWLAARLRGEKPSVNDIITDALHAMRHNLKLDNLGRWQESSK